MSYSRWIPTEAKILDVLERSTNRSVSDRHVAQLAISMAAGEWIPEISPLLFYPDGRLADGQHRLWAYIKAGCPKGIYFLSAVINDADITKVDAGRSRSTSDHAKILGLGFNHKHVAAARVALALEQGTYITSNVRATHDMVIDACSKYRVEVFVKRSIPATVTGTLAFIGAERGVMPFFDQIIHGENLTRNDPAYHVRSMVLTLGSLSLGKCRDELVVKTVKAWNFYARGESIGKLYAGDRPWKWMDIERKEAKDGALLPR